MDADHRLDREVAAVLLAGVGRAPTPSQDGVAAPVEKVSERILRLLDHRGAITLVTAPGDGKVTVVTDEAMAIIYGSPGPKGEHAHRRAYWPARHRGEED